MNGNAHGAATMIALAKHFRGEKGGRYQTVGVWVDSDTYSYEDRCEQLNIINWASEASPTLGCSIEISRDIYIYVCRYVSYAVKLTA